MNTENPNQSKNESPDGLAAMLGGAEEVLDNEETLDENLGEDETEEAGGEEQTAEEDGAGEAGEIEEETDEGATKAPTEAESEIAALKEQNRIIMEQLGKLTKKEELKEEKPEALVSADYIADEDLDDVMTDKTKLNALLQKVADHAYNKAIESVLKLTPGLVTRAASSEVTNQIAAMEFYRENDDLVPHKSSVQSIYADMLAKNPDKSPFVVLKSLAPEVRKRLKLKPRGQQQQQGQQQIPKKKHGAFAPGTGASPNRQPSAPKGIGSEISKMMKV